MKKLSLVLTLILLSMLIAACDPIDPEEVCRAEYEAHPGLPHNFIGVCVASIKTNNPEPLVSLCGSEVFREVYLEGSVDTRQACIDAILNMEE